MAKTTTPPAKGAKGAKGAGKPDRAAKRELRATKKAARKARFAQLRQAFTMTRRADPKLIPLLLVAFLVPFVLLLSLGLLLGGTWVVVLGFLGFLLGFLATTATFGRRVQATAYSQVEGMPGAAASVIQQMRGDWRVTPAVGFTAQQDLLHRVVGRPGVVLVREGSPNRTKALLIAEKKKLARFVGDTPVYDLQVGEGEGALSLKELERHFAKLPRNIKPRDVNILDRKLKAMAPALPIPTGPVPMNGRVPRGKVR